MYVRIFIATIAIGLSGLSLTLGSELHWPQFRGANGSGVAENQKPPMQFGPGTNEIFKIKVPEGASSPCIVGDRLFLTGYADGKLLTLCYNARDGKLLWQREAPFEKLEAFYRGEGSPAASTPASDGERVYSYFGSSGVFAYTLAGEKVWEHKLPTAEHTGDFGTGTSPVVHDGIVLINRDMLKGSHLLALHARSGEKAWRVERPEFFSGWSTPVIRKVADTTEVILAGAQRIKAYDLKSGAERWSFSGLPNAVCPTPVLDGEVVYFAGWSPSSSDAKMPSFPSLREKQDKNSDGAIGKDEAEGIVQFLFRTFDVDENGKIEEQEWVERITQMERSVNQAVALRPTSGNLDEKDVIWSYTRGLPYVPSAVVYNGKYYMVRDGGMVTCLDARTGNPNYEQERLGASGNYYPSLVAADGRIYLCSNDGKMTVLAAGEKPEVLARAELGERTVTTPALAHNRIYIRSANHLWCFGDK